MRRPISGWRCWSWNCDCQEVEECENPQPFGKYLRCWWWWCCGADDNVVWRKGWYGKVIRHAIVCEIQCHFHMYSHVTLLFLSWTAFLCLRRVVLPGGLRRGEGPVPVIRINSRTFMRQLGGFSTLHFKWLAAIQSHPIPVSIAHFSFAPFNFPPAQSSLHRGI